MCRQKGLYIFRKQPKERWDWTYVGAALGPVKQVLYSKLVFDRNPFQRMNQVAAASFGTGTADTKVLNTPVVIRSLLKLIQLGSLGAMLCEKTNRRGKCGCPLHVHLPIPGIDSPPGVDSPPGKPETSHGWKHGTDLNHAKEFAKLMTTDEGWLPPSEEDWPAPSEEVEEAWLPPSEVLEPSPFEVTEPPSSPPRHGSSSAPGRLLTDSPPGSEGVEDRAASAAASIPSSQKFRHLDQEVFTAGNSSLPTPTSGHQTPWNRLNTPLIPVDRFTVTIVHPSSLPTAMYGVLGSFADPSTTPPHSAIGNGDYDDTASIDDPLDDKALTGSPP